MPELSLVSALTLPMSDVRDVARKMHGKTKVILELPSEKLRFDFIILPGDYGGHVGIERQVFRENKPIYEWDLSPSIRAELSLGYMLEAFADALIYKHYGYRVLGLEHKLQITTLLDTTGNRVR